MPLSAELSAVIEAANALEAAETRIDGLQNDKARAQQSVADITAQIQAQRDIAAAARLALKAAVATL